MKTILLTTRIKTEGDVVLVRQQAKQIAACLGFDAQSQTRIATAVSEIARNAFNYAQGGKVTFFFERQQSHQGMMGMTISDEGPGIRHVQDVLSGVYRSTTGMGAGIVGARRLMDQFTLQSEPERGTTVTMGKLIPGDCTFSREELTHLVKVLDGQLLQDLPQEVRSQNQELLQALTELQRRQEELEQLNHELEDTNRGVLALYAELDERAERLQRADEVKSRFLSHMSHEFRTPLSSMIALSHILLSRADGDLTPEQEKQVTFIHKAAANLSELVNDLLDLAKVEAGKIEVHPETFTATDLFSALRGMMRPLLTNPAVTLHFADIEDLPPLYTDEGKVAQILRNLISNALKFTEKGSVQVSASLEEADQVMLFAVADTGIGIAPPYQEQIFQEFGQLDNPIQRRVKGTGLGLPLSRKLAELLGGTLTVVSELNVGSTFYATIPLNYPHASAPLKRSDAPDRQCILLIEDEEVARYVFRSWLSKSNYQLLEATNGFEGLKKARQYQPDVIFLDLVMPDLSGFQVLEQLKSDRATHHIPVMILTSKHLDAAELSRLQQHAAAIFSKVSISPEHVLEQIALMLPQPASMT